MRLSNFFVVAGMLATGLCGQTRGQGTPVFPSSGVNLLGQILPDELDPQMVWTTKVSGYASPSGREYAVVGTRNGTCFVEVTDPGAPVVLAVFPTHYAFYRTLRTYGSHAYVTNSTNGDIRVYDLAQIDSGVVTLVNTVDGGPGTTHNTAVDETSGFLYRFGFENGPGFLVYDLADPVNPVLAGQWGPASHDGQPITYTSGPFAGVQIVFACSPTPTNSLRLIDVTDKANPVQIAEVFYPDSGLAHQVWLSEDLRWAFFNDEFDELFNGLPSTTHVFDVQDIFAPQLAASFTNGNSAVTHDNFVRDDLLFCANYTSGLRVFDVTDPLAAVEIAWFDTWPCNDANELLGLYSVDPFLPSGTVLGCSTEDGLFTWTLGPPELTFSYPEGLSGRIDPAGQTITVAIGQSAPGQLVPESPALYYDDGSGLQSAPLAPSGPHFEAQLPPLPCGALVRYYVSARSKTGITWTDPPAATTRPERHTANVVLAGVPLFQDDFEVDLGWAASAQNQVSGEWERVDPNGTPYAPEDDHTRLGTKCWVTGNAAPGCNSLQNEVSGGPFFLTSPPLDLSGASDPRVQYARWFANDGLPVRDDELLVEVTADGSVWVPAETVGPTPPGTSGGWILHQFRLLDHVPLSASVQLRFVVADRLSDSLVEAAIDDVFIFEAVCQGPVTYCTAGTSASGCRALISWSGTPSATAGSGFLLLVPEVEGDKDGQFYFGTNGAQAVPWGNGTSYRCIMPPTKRAGILMGAGNQGQCDGFFVQDLNTRWQAAPNSNPGAGASVRAQLWYRDPFSTSNRTTSFSDALELTVLP